MGVENKKVVLLSAVLCNDNNKYLLVQEAKDKPYSKCKDKWTLPHGSYDRKGESILDLAKRELLEETGGVAEFSGKNICLEGWSIPSDRVLLICITWNATNWIKRQNKISDEIKDVKFFTKKEIDNFAKKKQIRDDIPVLEIIEQFEKGQNGIIRWNLGIKA